MSEFKLFIALMLMAVPSFLAGQTVHPGQNIRGTVTDASNGEPLPFATVVLQNELPLRAVTADSVGRYLFSGVPMGRYDVQAIYLGYSPQIAKEVLVTSAREAIADIAMWPGSAELGEVTVTPVIDKTMTKNKMVLTGGRTLSVEEAARYAGGLDDPARLASAFAGVQTNIGDNGIVVRGNAPKMLQWRLEGIEIPNPNHFGEVGGFGGGGLTALSAQALGNSDFLTGAFPAEYGNALSGVFDLTIRNGNSNRRQNTVSVGTMGVDIASEGPFRKDSNGSYVFNYRYSTLQFMSAFLPEGSGGMRYQDLSFKFNIPTKRAGTFALWGLGLIDRSKEKAKTDREEWQYEADRTSYGTRIYTGVVGLTHRVGLGNSAFLKTVIATTVSSIRSDADRIDDAMSVRPDNVIRKTNLNFVLNSTADFKLSERTTSRSGISFTGMTYDLLLRNRINNDGGLLTIADEKDRTALIEAYTDFSSRLGSRWTLKAGLHGSLFLLNNHYALEPRIGVKYQFSKESSAGLSYGLHSRLEQINYYFSRTHDGKLHNKNLDFTRAHHFVASFDRGFARDYHIRVEPYCQVLYNVPVVADSSLSLVNLRDEWFIRDKFVSNGRGLNFGVELTVEKYLSKGYYWLFTGSLYSSRYRGGDGKWYNTRYNRGYMVNGLFGKEWMVGHNRRDMISANVRLTLSGGNRYSPVREKESEAIQDVVFDETQAYSKQLAPAFWADFTVYYRMNSRAASHEIGLKMLNATFYSEYLDHQYNFKTGKVDVYRDGISMPNLYYKIEF